MGLFGFGKKPDQDTPVLSGNEVRQRLLELNRETAPYQIIDGSAENVDLIAEWKIVDAQWYEIFAKAGIRKVFMPWISTPSNPANWARRVALE